MFNLNYIKMETLKTTLTNVNFYFNLIKFSFIGLIAFSIVCILIQVYFYPERISFAY